MSVSRRELLLGSAAVAGGIVAAAFEPLTAFADGPGGYVDYLVKSGDVLGRLAKNFHTTVEELCRLNNISDRNKIRAGQVLKVPQGGGEIVSVPQTPTAAPDVKPNQAPKPIEQVSYGRSPAEAYPLATELKIRNLGANESLWLKFQNPDHTRVGMNGAGQFLVYGPEKEPTLLSTGNDSHTGQGRYDKFQPYKLSWSGGQENNGRARNPDAHWYIQVVGKGEDIEIKAEGFQVDHSCSNTANGVCEPYPERINGVPVIWPGLHR